MIEPELVWGQELGLVLISDKLSKICFLKNEFIKISRKNLDSGTLRSVINIEKLNKPKSAVLETLLGYIWLTSYHISKKK